MPSTVTGTGTINITGSGALTVSTTSSSTINSNASISLDGTDAYLNFPDDSNWGDLGALESLGEDYCFGWKFMEDWQLGAFDTAVNFSRNQKNAWALQVGSSFQYINWTGADNSSQSSGTSDFSTHQSGGFVNGDAIQFNFDSSQNRCKIYVNGSLRENVQMAELSTKPQSSGVVRFGFPVTPSSGSYNYYKGKIGGLWFARNHLFSDGQVSLDQSSDLDITEKSYYSDITSFFNLGANSYPNIVDEKGNVPDGSLVNGVSNDFHTS